MYVTTGVGSTAANQVIKLTDTTGFNSTIAITTGNNVTLYTAGAAATLKGIAFAPTTYSVTYNDNGKTSGSVPTDSTGYGLYATVTVAANSGSLAKTGYTFAGWNTQADGNGTTYTAGSGTFTINANTTLYAKWTANTYTVTYDANGGTGSQTDNNSPYNSGATVTVLGAGSISRAGYTFTGWNTQSGGGGTAYAPNDTFAIAANTTLYAQWTANGYVVNYDTNGGTGSQVDNNNPYNSGATVTVLGTGTIARTGYTFAGWNTQAGGGGTSYNPADTFTMPAGSVTLYAQWTINSYTLTYDGNGNDGGNAPSAVSQNYNTTATVSGVGTLTKTGYTFAGWNTAANGSGTAYAASSTFTFTGNTTLYAQWTINTYTVTFNNNTGSGTMTAQTGNYNTTAALTANTFTKTGYTFAGWNTAADGTGTAYANGASYTFTASTTLYAQWAINTYTVTYDANGGTGSQTDPSSPYNYNSTVTVLGVGSITRSGGYTFTGWNTAANASGTAYAVSDTFTIAANTTLYAQWKTPFGAGDLAIVLAAASAANTTCSVVEINTTSSAQSAIQTISIPGTGASAIRVSGSGTSTLYAADNNDGSLFAFTGVNTTDTSDNVNGLNPRAVVTVNNAGMVAIPTTYTAGTSGGKQTRGASSVDNANWLIGDQNGTFLNGGSSPQNPVNCRAIKSFGGTFYVLQQSSSGNPVSTVSANGATITVLPGLSATGTGNEFDYYLVSSGNNGSTYDVLYILSATATSVGTIAKYALVSGSWTAEGTYTTTFGGFGLCAAKDGSGGFYLYATTGTGATTANRVIKLDDTAAWNATINITTANNVTLYTAATGTIIKGIAFAPKATPAFNLSSSTNPSGYKDSVSFTANGFAADVTGTVQFTTNGVNLGSAVAISGQSAVSIAAVGLPRGGNPITAIYSGDANYASVTKTLTQTVTNHPPSASVQYLTLVSNTVLTVSAATLAGLSYDADGDSLTITAVSANSTNGGTASLSGGDISYTPVQDFVGADQFTYTIDDGMGGTSTGTAKVTVRSANPTFGSTYIHSPATGKMDLRAYGIPGHYYDVQKSTDSTFPPGTITTLNGSPLQAAPNGVILYTDENATEPQAYYRFVVR